MVLYNETTAFSQNNFDTVGGEPVVRHLIPPEGLALLPLSSSLISTVLLGHRAAEADKADAWLRHVAAGTRNDEVRFKVAVNDSEVV